MLRVTSILLVMLSSAHAQWSAFSGLGVAQYESNLRQECNAGRRSSCYELRVLIDRRREEQEQIRHRELVDAIRSGRR